MGKTIAIENGIVLTMNSDREIFKEGSVVIEDDRILEVGDSSDVKKNYTPDISIDAKNKIVIPGLISLHHHSDNMSRGVGEHMGLHDYLEKIYYPMLSKATPEETKLTALLSYTEAILSGTTTVNEMYVNLESCAEAAEEIGIRAVMSSEAADLIEGYGESLDLNEKAFKELDGSADGRIRIWFGAEWVPVCSEDFLIKTRELADKYETGIHIHLNESKDEVELCKKEHGKGSAEYVNELGVLGDDVVSAHSVWLSEKEQNIFSERGVSVAHCPVSNLKLGNGIAPIPELIEKGVNVGLGPDGAPCNNTVNMFETMKFASLVQKGRFLDASQMPSEKVLEMATINGAKALGLEDEIGSLEKGKKADIVLVDLDVPNLRPIYYGKNLNAYSHLVYASPNAVDTVLIDGKLIVRDGKIDTVDEEKLLRDFQTSADGLIDRI